MRDNMNLFDIIYDIKINKDTLIYFDCNDCGRLYSYTGAVIEWIKIFFRENSNMPRDESIVQNILIKHNGHDYRVNDCSFYQLYHAIMDSYIDDG
jgi:hypothetical protein